MRAVLVAMAASLGAGCEMIDEGPHSGTVFAPTWADAAPTSRDIMAAYPPEALSRDLDGLVRLRCTVTPVRKLDCIVDSETPPGYGFGAAGLAVARIFVVRKDYPRAQPGEVVVVPVRFVVG